MLSKDNGSGNLFPRRKKQVSCVKMSVNQGGIVIHVVRVKVQTRKSGNKSSAKENRKVEIHFITSHPSLLTVKESNARNRVLRKLRPRRVSPMGAILRHKLLHRNNNDLRMGKRIMIRKKTTNHGTSSQNVIGTFQLIPCNQKVTNRRSLGNSNG